MSESCGRWILRAGPDTFPDFPLRRSARSVRAFPGGSLGPFLPCDRGGVPGLSSVVLQHETYPLATAEGTPNRKLFSQLLFDQGKHVENNFWPMLFALAYARVGKTLERKKPPAGLAQGFLGVSRWSEDYDLVNVSPIDLVVVSCDLDRWLVPELDCVVKVRPIRRVSVDDRSLGWAVTFKPDACADFRHVDLPLCKECYSPQFSSARLLFDP